MAAASETLSAELIELDDSPREVQPATFT